MHIQRIVQEKWSRRPIDGSLWFGAVRLAQIICTTKEAIALCEPNTFTRHESVANALQHLLEDAIIPRTEYVLFMIVDTLRDTLEKGLGLPVKNITRNTAHEWFSLRVDGMLPCEYDLRITGCNLEVHPCAGHDESITYAEAISSILKARLDKWITEIYESKEQSWWSAEI